MRTADLAKWIVERHKIYQAKTAGLPKPWTTDPILRDYRFCNVYRELDKVTVWIAQNWRNPHKQDPNVWFAMAVARFVNWPDTLEELGYPVPFKADRFVHILNARKAAGEKVFTGAYMIPAGANGEDKATYLAAKVLGPLWMAKEYILEATGSLAHFNKRLREFHGMGSFLTGQVVADAKFTPALECSLDWWEFAVEGPGSRRGLNRVCGRPVDQTWVKHEWLPTLLELKARISPLVELDAKMPRLSAQDLQNCLCEFDKYERVRLGEGRPRNNYPGIS